MSVSKLLKHVNSRVHVIALYVCIFLFIFHISQIWKLVYIPHILYFACNDWYLVWFSSTYTSRKEKGLRRKKRMEARIVILIRKHYYNHLCRN